MQIHKLVFAAFGAAFFMSCAYAQNAGTVSNHAVPIGKGPGVQGFGSLALTSGQVIIGQSSADPQAKTLTGDVTVDNTGTTAIGANKVTNSQLATMPANTTKCNATAGTANPTDCNASTMRTNLGLVIGTNVQAWDADLDCIAAISSTGVISRTGAGTCSAGALALSGLATGTQDTVVGYFGSTTASAASVPNCTGSLNYSTGTHTFGCGLASPVIASRATATTIDLSAFSTVQTLGYATAGDGGGATFYKLASTSTPFPESYISSNPTITTAGTGCTNGTYRGLMLTGGSGTGAVAVVVVAGNVVTSVTLVWNAGGSGYTVGNVLSVSGIGCSVAPSFTVTSVSTPVASFTDSAGNRWAYVPSSAMGIDARQFGYKADWFGTDGSATNNYGALSGALKFASTYFVTFSSNASVSGARVVIPPGVGMICGGVSLIVYGGSELTGHGPNASALHKCDTWSPNTSHFVTLCDTIAQIACFGAHITNLKLEATLTPDAANTVSMLYSRSVQQAEAVRNVFIYAGKARCFTYEIGDGGAAMASFYDILCTVFNGSTNTGITVNVGTTEVLFKNLIIEGNNLAVNGFDAVGGQITIDGFHSEAMATPISVNLTTATHSMTLMHASGGASCTGLVTLQGTNTAGNFALFDAVKNGCSPNLVTNGQGGGTSRTTDAKPSAGWVSFNP